MALLERYVRTDGAATNGGSTDSATPLLSGTAGSSSGATVTLDTTSITSDHIGHLIRIADATGGQGATGSDIFRIATTPANNQITVVPTPAADVSNKAWAIGGALTIEKMSTTYATRANLDLSPAANGEHWNIGAGTYTLTATLNLAQGDTGYLKPIVFEGATGTRPIITSTGRTAIYTTGRNLVFRHLDLRIVADGNNEHALDIRGEYATVFDCFFDISFSGSPYSCACIYKYVAYCNIINCKLINSLTNANSNLCIHASSTGVIFGNIIKGSVLLGWGGADYRTSTFSNNIIYDALGSGVYSQPGYCAQFMCNTIYNCSQDGIYISSASYPPKNMVISNNIIYDCGRYGINSESTTGGNVQLLGNAIGACTSGLTNLATNYTIDVGNVTLTGDPFVDAANGDFRLNNTTGAGAACRGVGFPTDINMDGTQDNWLDIGALQAEPSAGGVLPTSFPRALG